MTSFFHMKNSARAFSWCYGGVSDTEEDERANRLDRVPVFISGVKFAVNQKRDVENDFRLAKGEKVTEKTLKWHQRNEYRHYDFATNEKRIFSPVITVGKSSKTKTRNVLFTEPQDSNMAVSENSSFHRGRSASNSPHLNRQTSMTYMDDGPPASPGVQGEEEAARHRLKRFNYSIRSTASIYSTTATEATPWSKSGEAWSSLISVLSALYAMVLVILSLAFEVSIVVVDSVSSDKYDIFYVYLYVMALLFFAYCQLFLLRSDGGYRLNDIFDSCVEYLRVHCWKGDEEEKRNVAQKQSINSEDLRNRRMLISLKRRVTHSASSAGSLYLRMGCIVFGVVGLIMKGLQLFSAYDRRNPSICISSTWVAETVLAAVFIFVQMFFIFQNTKLIIHRFKTIGRFGAMHLIATNLCMWIRSLIEEQTAIMHEIKEGHNRKGHGAVKHGWSLSTNSTTANQNGTYNATVHFTPDASICNSLGARYGGVNTLIADVEPFMTTCIIEYSLICSAVMYILWRNIGHVPKQRVRQRKQRFHVDCTASTQGLFLGLLFMVYTIVSMVIFFTKVRAGSTEEALSVFYTAYVVLFSGSICALCVGMYRMRKLYYVHYPQKKNILLLDDILLIVGLIGQLMFCVFSIVPLNNWNFVGKLIVVSSLLRMLHVLWQTVFIFFGQRLATLTAEMQTKNPGREMVTFLLMTNLSLFLINTFETHKAGAIPHLFQFYGEAVWMVIVHSTVPLCIFYRFHSTVCLAEIWKQVYRVKTAEVPVL